MFNAVTHRQTLVLMLVFLLGIWVGRTGLLASRPEAAYSDIGGLRGIPSNVSPDTLQNAAASHGVRLSDMNKTDSGKPAGDNTPAPGKATVEPTDMRAAGRQIAPASSREDAVMPGLWQAPIRTDGGDIVIPLEAAGVPEAAAQNPAENILGVIVQAN